MLYFLVKVMVFTSQGLILAPYGFQLMAERLKLHCRIAALFGGLFKVSDMVGSYTKVQSDGNRFLEPWNIPLERISHLLDLLP